jgi:hypothetical protein
MTGHLNVDHDVGKVHPGDLQSSKVDASNDFWLNQSL